MGWPTKMCPPRIISRISLGWLSGRKRHQLDIAETPQRSRCGPHVGADALASDAPDDPRRIRPSGCKQCGVYDRDSRNAFRWRNGSPCSALPSRPFSALTEKARAQELSQMKPHVEPLKRVRTAVETGVTETDLRRSAPRCLHLRDWIRRRLAVRMSPRRKQEDDAISFRLTKADTENFFSHLAAFSCPCSGGAARPSFASGSPASKPRSRATSSGPSPNRHFMDTAGAATAAAVANEYPRLSLLISNL